MPGDDAYRRPGNTGLVHVFLLIGLFALYLATRLTHLDLLPVFTDEAVYMQWSQTIANDFSEALRPVRVENNRPLFFWLTAISLKAIADPLLAGRMVSVIAGFFALAGVYCIACRLHSKWAGLLAGFAYVVSPYHLFFDRIAHKAALLDGLFVWLAWLTLRLSRPGGRIRAQHGLILGLLATLSLLADTTALLFVFLPLPFLLYSPAGRAHWKLLFLCYGVALMAGVFPNAYLHFTDDNYQMKNIFIPSYNSMAQTRLVDMIPGLPRKIIQSAEGVFDHFRVYLTWPVIVSALFYFIRSLGRMDRNRAILSVHFILPTLALMGTAGVGFSRYYLFCATPVLIWGALGLAEISGLVKRAFSRNLAFPVFVIGFPFFFLPATLFDAQLLTSPQNAPLSGTDQYQYIASEFSGYGSSQAIEFLKAMAQDKKIAVFTTSNWGVPDDCVTLYLSGSPNISIFMGYWAFKQPLLPPAMESFDIYDKFTARHLGKFHVKDLPQDVYFIARTPSVSRSFFLGMNENFRLIQSFRKPLGTNTIDIYKMNRP